MLELEERTESWGYTYQTCLPVSLLRGVGLVQLWPKGVKALGKVASPASSVAARAKQELLGSSCLFLGFWLLGTL